MKSGIKRQFVIQWKGQWVIIILTILTALIATFLAIWTLWITIQYRVEDKIQFSSPLFRYKIDLENKILIEPSENSIPTVVAWIIPGLNSSSTAIYKNSLPVSDIASTIFHDLIISDGSISPFDNNYESFLKCEVFNQFESYSTSTIDGVPVGVQIDYIVKGESAVHRTFDLILLRDFDSEQIQIFPFPSVQWPELSRYLYEKGNKRLKEALEHSNYSKDVLYEDNFEKCNQKTWSTIKFDLLR